MDVDECDWKVKSFHTLTSTHKPFLFVVVLKEWTHSLLEHSILYQLISIL